MAKTDTPPPAPPPAADDAVTLTKAELQKLIDDNRGEVEKTIREKLDAEHTKAREKEKEDAERAEAEKRGEFEKVAQKEAEKREAAEIKAAAAERRAQLAEVNVQLRDHLAEKHPDYLANAADIMLHVEKVLTPDAKPEAVAKLIEEQAKAFVERTPRQKQIGGTPAPLGRGANIPANVPKPNPEARTTRRWAAMQYRG